MTPWLPGNRWAGGSGGADTAGLGGRGGPYRSGSLGWKTGWDVRTWKNSTGAIDGMCVFIRFSMTLLVEFWQFSGLRPKYFSMVACGLVGFLTSELSMKHTDLINGPPSCEFQTPVGSWEPFKLLLLLRQVKNKCKQVTTFQQVFRLNLSKDPPLKLCFHLFSLKECHQVSPNAWPLDEFASPFKVLRSLGSACARWVTRLGGLVGKGFHLRLLGLVQLRWGPYSKVKCPDFR